RRTPRSTLFPYTTLFRSSDTAQAPALHSNAALLRINFGEPHHSSQLISEFAASIPPHQFGQNHMPNHIADRIPHLNRDIVTSVLDRKSTRLNSSHVKISY